MSVVNQLTVVPVTEDAATAATQFAGYNFVNSTGAAITVSIYDGNDAADVLICSVVVPANGSVDVMYPKFVPLTSASIFVNWTTGIAGSIRVTV